MERSVAGWYRCPVVLVEAADTTAPERADVGNDEAGVHDARGGFVQLDLPKRLRGTGDLLHVRGGKPEVWEIERTAATRRPLETCMS